MKPTLRTLAAIALAGAALSLTGPAHADDTLDATDQPQATNALVAMVSSNNRSTLGNEEWLLVGNSLFSADGSVEFKCQGDGKVTF